MFACGANYSETPPRIIARSLQQFVGNVRDVQIICLQPHQLLLGQAWYIGNSVRHPTNRQFK
jgi:hypothetical protein